MVQFALDEEVDEVFSRTKTEETAQKAGQKVRAVTYHTASIQDHVTTFARNTIRLSYYREKWWK